MNLQTVKNVEMYNFPGGEDVKSMLYWMGADYLEYIVENLNKEFTKQNPGTVLIAIKCQSDPEFQSRVQAPTNYLSEVSAEFALQILLRDNSGQAWRLNCRDLYLASALDGDSPSIGHTLTINSADKV